MNIIEAWVKAMDGQTIYRSNVSSQKYLVSKGNDKDNLREILYKALDAYHVSADDWEVIKTPHHKEKAFGELRSFIDAPSFWEGVPDNAKVSVDWED